MSCLRAAPPATRQPRWCWRSDRAQSLLAPGTYTVRWMHKGYRLRYPFTPSSDPEIRDAASDARSWAQGAVRCRIQPFRVATGSLRRGQREADGDDSWSSTRGAERSVSERFGKALARIQRAVRSPGPTPVNAYRLRARPAEVRLDADALTEATSSFERSRGQRIRHSSIRSVNRPTVPPPFGMRAPSPSGRLTEKLKSKFSGS